MTELSLRCRLTFGKYKGLILGDVIGFAPETVLWYVANIDWFKLDAEAKDRLRKAVSLERNNTTARQDAWAMGSFCGNGAWAKTDADKARRQKSRLEFEARSRVGQQLDENLKWIAQ